MLVRPSSPFSSLLTTRLKELKAALAARAGMTPVARQSPSIAPIPPGSSGSTLASDPPPIPHRVDYPTPDTTVGPSRPRPPMASVNVFQSQNHTPSLTGSPRGPIRHLHTSHKDSPTPLAPPKSQKLPPPRKRQAPTPPPEIDDMDIAMAEAEEFDEQEELIPPSSPPPPPARRMITPSRPTRSAQQNRQAALAEMAEMQNLPLDEIFSSPPRPSPQKLPRVEASASRPINAEAGPSKVVQTPKPIKIEVRHPWSKEVEDKMKTYFKIPKFRFHQKESIDETMAGKDGELSRLHVLQKADHAVFVLMPTGGGKSLTCKSGGALPVLLLSLC